jgi:muconate cycloisomerase
MRIAAIDLFPLRLPMREAFRISRGPVGDPASGAPHLYLRITTESGAVGWGEARPSHRWSYETIESVIAAIRTYFAPTLIGLPAWDRDAVTSAMGREIAPGISTGCPIARSAVDMALHDLLARAAGVSLGAFLGGRAESSVALCRLISVGSPGEAARRAVEAVQEGYEGLKVKLAGQLAGDVELLRAVREAAPRAYLWADANQAYDLATATVLARRMEQLGADCLEQPLPANDWTGIRRLCAATALPIAADESVFSPADLIQLLKLEALDLLVLKVSKMGGLANALLAMQIAREAGIGLLGSGLTESSLGFAASAHLYGAFGTVSLADLNGPQFLEDDPIAEPLRIERGRVFTTTSRGIGVTVSEEKLARLATRET